MPIYRSKPEVYNVKVYRGSHYQGSVVVTIDRRNYRSMSGSHTLSADLEELEVACRSAATFFGVQANATTVSDLVQRRLDELIEEEQRKGARDNDKIYPDPIKGEPDGQISTHDPEA